MKMSKFTSVKFITFRVKNNLSSIRNSDEIMKNQTDSFEHKEKATV